MVIIASVLDRFDREGLEAVDLDGVDDGRDHGAGDLGHPAIAGTSPAWESETTS